MSAEAVEACRDQLQTCADCKRKQSMRATDKVELTGFMQKGNEA